METGEEKDTDCHEAWGQRWTFGTNEFMHKIIIPGLSWSEKESVQSIFDLEHFSCTNKLVCIAETEIKFDQLERDCLRQKGCSTQVGEVTIVVGKKISF